MGFQISSESSERESQKRKAVFEEIHRSAQKRYEEILRQREMILEAFIAETGLKQSEIVQVEQHTPQGHIWYVAKRGEVF